MASQRRRGRQDDLATCFMRLVGGGGGLRGSGFRVRTGTPRSGITTGTQRLEALPPSLGAHSGSPARLVIHTRWKPDDRPSENPLPSCRDSEREDRRSARPFRSNQPRGWLIFSSREQSCWGAVAMSDVSSVISDAGESDRRRLRFPLSHVLVQHADFAARALSQPLMTLIFGRLTTSFTGFGSIILQIQADPGNPALLAQLAAAREQLKHDSSLNALYLVIIGESTPSSLPTLV